MNLTSEDVDEIIRLLDTSFYDELRIKTDKFDLYLRRDGLGWSEEHRTLEAPELIGDAARVQPSKPAEAPSADEKGCIAIRAPMVGTFYRAPKPGAPPFVEIGAEVGEHTVVGIIETMKLMNSVPAGASGKIVEICVADGEVVEVGQMLMRLLAP